MTTEDPIIQPGIPAMEVATIPTEAKEITLEDDGVEEGDESSSEDDLKKQKPTDKPTDAEEERDADPFIDTPMREFTYSGGIFSKQPLAFNPLTSFIGFAVLWSVSIW